MPSSGTLQGTITHPTKRESWKLMDSKVTAIVGGYVIVPRRVLNKKSHLLGGDNSNIW